MKSGNNKNWSNKHTTTTKTQGRINQVSTKPAKANYPEVKYNGESTIIIPEDVQQDIDHLHAKVGQVEWSGLLVYEVTKGDVTNPETMEITARGIYLFDIGSPGYTEFEVGSEIIDVYEDFPELMESPDTWKYGKIHTHHSMDAYHSPTDVRDLHEQSEAHAFYVSLVVNFDGVYDCEIAILTKEADRTLVHKDGMGGETSCLIKGQERLLRIDCKIVKPEPTIPPCSEVVAKRFAKLEADRQAAIFAKSNALKSRTQYPSTQQSMFAQWDELHDFNESFNPTTVEDIVDLSDKQAIDLIRFMCYSEPDEKEFSCLRDALKDLNDCADIIGEADTAKVLEQIESNIPSALMQVFKMPTTAEFMASCCMSLAAMIECEPIQFPFNDEFTSVLQNVAFQIDELS